MLNLPLRTRRLIARDFEPSDFDAIHAYASDPEVTRFMFYGPRTPAARIVGQLGRLSQPRNSPSDCRGFTVEPG